MDSRIQVQPALKDAEAWDRLAQAHDLTYELMSLAFPAYDLPAIRAAFPAQRITAFHAPFIDMNPVSAEPEIRRVSQARLFTAAADGASLGARYMVLHTSCYPGLADPAYYRRWSEEMAGFLADMTHRFPLTVCVENTLDRTPDALAALMSLTDGLPVCVCLDVGHAYLSPTPLADWFEALSPHIGYMHLNDNRGRTDDHLALGDGCIPWADLRIRFARMTRELPVTLEMPTIPDVLRSLEGGFLP